MLNVFDDTEFVRRILVHNCQGSVVVRAESQLSRRVIPIGVDSIADRQRGDYLPAVGVHHDHLLIAASYEQSPVLTVHRHSGWLFTRSERPSGLDRQPPGIEGNHLVLVLDIYIHRAPAV